MPRKTTPKRLSPGFPKPGSIPLWTPVSVRWDDAWSQMAPRHTDELKTYQHCWRTTIGFLVHHSAKGMILAQSDDRESACLVEDNVDQIWGLPAGMIAEVKLLGEPKFKGPC